jgi:transposase
MTPSHTIAPEPPLVGSPISCPLCHTVNPTMTDDALATGAYWVCTRCGQTWDAHRLAAVAAYARYCAESSPKARRDEGLRRTARSDVGNNAVGRMYGD